MSVLSHARTSLRRIALMTVAVLAVTVFTPIAPALAAKPVSAYKTDVFESFGVMLTDLESTKEPTLVITGVIKPGVKLPVDIAMPIPTGSETSWAGEIFGKDPTKDIMAKIGVEEGKPYSKLYFTVTKSRYVQAEVSVPTGWVTQATDGAHVKIEWAPYTDVSLVRMAIATTKGYAATPITKLTTQTAGPSGEAGYYLDAKNVKAGQATVLEAIVHTVKAAGSSTTATGTVATPTVLPVSPVSPVTAPAPKFDWLILLLIVGLVGAVGFLFYALRRGSATAGDDEDVSDDYEDEAFTDASDK